MVQIEVDAFDDRSRPEGGHAIILLRGVTGLSDRPTFRLRLVEPGMAKSEDFAWIGRDLTPLAAEPLGGDAILKIGPDVTGILGLLPGTAVEISLPEAQVRGEFLWPAITPPGRPRRGTPPPRAHAGNPTVDEQGASAAARPPPAPGPFAAAPPSAPVDAIAEAAGAAPAASAGGGLLGLLGGWRATLAAAARAASGRARPLLPASREAYAATAVVGVLAFQGIAYLLLAPAFSRTAPPASPPLVIARPAASDLSIYDALAVGMMSPRGFSAHDVQPAHALERAQGLIGSASGQRDTDEAAFWLKRYIAATMGDERLRRVLTQLGSTYAEPGQRRPDYHKARGAWELAAAFGDPIAMCFLGLVHENGLGVTVSRLTALEWYERARRSGGCSFLDAALARVKR